MNVKAVFTGRPPFSGNWSDGSAFTTSSSSISHEVSKADAYTITRFTDHTCQGTVSGSAIFDGGSGVTVELRGSACTNGTIVATFTGVPPFSGVWSDTLVPFTMSQRTLEHKPKSEAYWYGIGEFHDAVCAEPYTQPTRSPFSIRRRSGAISTAAHARPRSSLCHRDQCPRSATGAREVVGRLGAEQTFPEGSMPARRLVPFQSGKRQQTYSIVEASNAACAANILPRSHVITFSDVPSVSVPSEFTTICPG